MIVPLLIADMQSEQDVFHLRNNVIAGSILFFCVQNTD